MEINSLQNLQQDASLELVKKNLYKVLANWYWFVLSIGLAMGYSWFKNKYTQPTYSVTTTLLISTSASNMAAVENLITELGIFRRKQQTDILNEIEILKSYQLSYNALSELPEFMVSYVAVGDIMETALYKSSPFIVDVDSLRTNATYKKVYISILNEDSYLLKINDNEEKIVQFGEKHSDSDLAFTIRFNGEFNRLRYKNPSRQERNFYFYLNDLHSLTNAYRNKISISLTNERARTLVLRSSGPSIQQEVDFLNKISEVYIRTELEEKNQMAEQAMDFIDTQIESLMETLESEGKKLQDFRSEHFLLEVSEQGQELYLRLKEIEKKRQRPK
ncbi:MAG: hypothetical protein HC896_10600 [Bacteroidales bacterium]|nr:hypothetical protein [Bacteroidales bacterium]